MLRIVIVLLIFIVAVTFLRAVIGLIGKAMSQAIEPEKTKPTPTHAAGGELKRDPVCGTYVAESVSLKKTIGKEVVYFCSPSCRDRYQG
jgi:YHS domain-containing protein